MANIKGPTSQASEEDVIRALLASVDRTADPRDERAKFRQAGEILRAVGSPKNYLPDGKIIVVARNDRPDRDSEYSVHYIDSDGDIEEGYVHYLHVEEYVKPAVTTVLTPRKGRKIDV